MLPAKTSRRYRVIVPSWWLCHRQRSDSRLDFRCPRRVSMYCSAMSRLSDEHAMTGERIDGSVLLRSKEESAS